MRIAYLNFLLSISMINCSPLFLYQTLKLSWGPSISSGVTILTNRIYIIWGCLQSNLTNSCIVALRKKIFNIISIYFHVKLWTPLGTQVLVLGSQFSQFRIYTIYTSLAVNIGISGAVGFFKAFSLFCKYLPFKKKLCPLFYQFQILFP